MAQVLPQYVDQLGNLRFFVENPKAIAIAHEEMRKQQALTDDEKKKADEAREFIKNYEKLSAELENKRLTLESTREHSEKVIVDLDKRKSQLDADEQMIDQKIKDHAPLEKSLLDLKAQLDAQKISQDKQQSLNEQEKAALQELSASVKTREKKVSMREQAADL